MKNLVLKSITAVAAVTYVLSALALDSENPRSAIIALVVSMIWLLLFVKANEERLGNGWK